MLEMLNRIDSDPLSNEIHLCSHCCISIYCEQMTLHVLTCDPADFTLCEVSGNPGHMRPQTVTQQMNPVPGQLQLFLKGR